MLSSQTKKLQEYIKNNPDPNLVDQKTISDIYQRLIDCIIDHNHLYYVENKPIISDLEYDQLFSYIKKIEEFFPSIISSNSPTQKLLNPISEGFEKANHVHEMLSLENSYDSQDILDRGERVNKIIMKNNPEFIEKVKYQVEPKYDGVSIELVYEDGILKQAITRGDGQTGELVTNNIKTIKNIPHKLSYTQTDKSVILNEVKNPSIQNSNDPSVITNETNLVEKSPAYNSNTEIFKQQAQSHQPSATTKGSPENEVIRDQLFLRGEIMITRQELEKINQEREKQGLESYSNTRNLASGSLKQLDPKVTAQRNLQCYIYDIVGENNGVLIEDLPKLGFSPYPIPAQIFDNIDDLVKYCTDPKTKEQFSNHISGLEFDGLVIKIVDKNLRKTIGSTAHHPRRAIAYKFPAQQISTKLLSVDRQVGRTGIITPVANLEPVQLSGVIISRVSLHNIDFIKNKNIQIGDYVWIQRSGEVIPYILGSILERRENTEKIIPPTHCPSCGHPTHQIDMHTYCTNISCPAQLQQKIEHFVSKQCMNIEGIGDRTAQVLIENKIITTIDELYQFTKIENQFKIKTLPGFADKKITEISQQLELSKQKPLRRLIHGLGIPHIGKKTAILIQEKIIEHIDLDKEIKLESLIDLLKNTTFTSSIHGIGEKIVISLQSFFQDPSNINIITNLAKQGINIDPHKYYGKITSPFSDIHFCITGSFHISRDIIISECEKQGMIFDPSPSKQSKYMIVGSKAGSKLAKAKELDIEILDGLDKIISTLPFLSQILNNTHNTPQKTQSSLF